MLVIGSDHGGYRLKEAVKKYLNVRHVEFVDFGTHSEESCDYPIIAQKVGEAVAAGEFEKGILICGTGIGISIAANKVKGVRAALCGDCFSAKYTRMHNDANILCLGGRVIGAGLASEIVEIFLNTPFEGGRHLRRIELISEMEK